MAYTVLARRYRSTTFDEVIGQEQVAQTLKKAIDTDRIAHAYLFCGTRGTGKTSTARILAKCLNCLSFDKPTPTPCNKCDSCLSISTGNDIDVIEIDAASNTGVDNVRDIISNAAFRPARARFKVYIIDEVHMLSKNAFNALLKILEEPPEHVKFILATTEPEKVLPTILSRCQRYDFRNIPTREIAAHLKEVCAKESIAVDEDALMLVAKSGAGSMRDSLSLLERLLSVGESHLTVTAVEQLLGLPRTQVLLELTAAIGSGNVPEVLSRVSDILMAGMSADTLLATLSDHFRDLLILNTCGADSGLVEVPGQSLKALHQQAQKFSAVGLTQNITILEELRRTMRQSQTGRSLMDATFVRLTLAEQFTNISALLSQVDATPTDGAESVAQKKNANEDVAATSQPFQPAPATVGGQTPALTVPDVETNKADEPPAPSPTSPSTAAFEDDDDDLPRPGKVWSGPSLADLARQSAASYSSAPIPAAPPAPTGPVPSESSVVPLGDADIGRIWPLLLSQLDNQGAALGGVLAMARLEAIDNDQAVIRFDPSVQTFVKRMQTNGKREVMAKFMSTMLGRAVGVRFEISDAPVQASAAPPARPPAANGTPRPAAQMTTAPPPPPVKENAVKLTPELTASIEQDPLVRAVMQELGARIVKVE